MRILWLLTIVVILFCTAPNAFCDTPCGSAGQVWPGDTDGSVRLTFSTSNNGDMLELIQRQDENIMVARGFVVVEGAKREFYALYDLGTNYLVHSYSSLSTNDKQAQQGFPTEYAMQSWFHVDVFAAKKEFTTDIKNMLANNQQENCSAEVVKMWQGRDYDKDKCDKTINDFNTAAAQFAHPDTATFKKITEGVQVKKYIESIRDSQKKSVLSGIIIDRNDPKGEKRAYCVGIQKVDMAIITALQKPETIKQIKSRAKRPDYLDDTKTTYEETTVERYRY